MGDGVSKLNIYLFVQDCHCNSCYSLNGPVHYTIWISIFIRETSTTSQKNCISLNDQVKSAACRGFWMGSDVAIASVMWIGVRRETLSPPSQPEFWYVCLMVTSNKLSSALYLKNPVILKLMIFLLTLCTRAVFHRLVDHHRRSDNVP